MEEGNGKEVGLGREIISVVMSSKSRSRGPHREH